MHRRIIMIDRIIMMMDAKKDGKMDGWIDANFDRRIIQDMKSVFNQRVSRQ